MAFEYNSNPNEEASIGGLRANIAAFFICISFFFGVSFLVSLAALILEKENNFVRFYAERTLALNLVLLILSIVNIFLFIGQIIFLIGFLVLIIFQLIVAFNAFKGKVFEIPYINKICDFLFV
ncbi:MAG: hypothetical protein KBF12_08235 [Sebaldella sp.]|nr:hypothetical protein [Sebaldella sp.]